MSTPQISKKKLKAIAFTDIVDFTKISADDEQHALNLIDKQREIVKPIVEKHNGEWLKEIGDGLLFSFDSSLDAVNCSIEIQHSLKDIDGFKIRIGIHQGDIFIKDGDVFGDDVNIASRVESFAPGGGIAVSDKISKDIAGVKYIKTKFIGHKKLKGVQQETKIKCITSHNLPPHKVSFLPKIFSYLSFFFGFQILILFILGLIALFLGESIFREEFIRNSNMNLTLPEFLADMFTELSLMFLLGYSCLSYYRGVSIKSQRAILFFTYSYLMYNVFGWVFSLLTGRFAIDRNWSDSQMIIYNIFFFLILFSIPLAMMGVFKMFFNKIKPNN